MNKEEYLHMLEICLKKHLSKSEVDDILMDYGEYFEDGRRQNKTDIEISAKLGPPEIIAQQFIEESKLNKKTSPSQEFKKLKEKTVSNIKSTKEKISLSKANKPVKASNGSIFGSFFDLIKFFIKLGISIFFGIIAFIASLAATFICLGFLFSNILMSISFIGIAICGLIFFASLFNIIPLFFSFAGIFGSIAALCIGILLAILFIYLIGKVIQLINLIIKKLFQKANINN